MIYHTVRVQLKPGVTPGEIGAALEHWRVMGRQIPAVRSWAVGRDVGDEFDYSALFVLDDFEGYLEYVDSALHHEAGLLAGPISQKVVLSDLIDDQDPRTADLMRANRAEMYGVAGRS